MKRKILFLMALLAGVLVLCTGCGREDKAGTELGEYVFVPQFYAWTGDIEGISVFGEYVYYSTGGGEIYRWKPEEGSEPELLMASELEGRNPKQLLQPDLEGNIYVLHSAYPYFYLAKYDSEGRELFCVDVPEWRETTFMNTAVDREGRLFVQLPGALQLYDVDGSYKGSSVPTDGEFLMALVGDGGGGVYCACIDDHDIDQVLRQVSFEEGFSEASSGSFMGGNGLNSIALYGETGVLTRFGEKLYLYDRDTEVQEPLLDFMNCGVEPNRVKQFGALGDGRIVVLLEETAGEGTELALLTKTEREQAPLKEVITVAILESSGSLQRSVARFNRQNENYRVEVKEYYDSVMSWREDGGREAAQTALHLDMVSGRCPDILALEYKELETYLSKGLLEDLTPYMEGNDTLDILPAVLEAYTIDGKLVSLPGTLEIRTMVGRAKDVGQEAGWTLEEMLEYVDSHPEECVFAVNQQRMLEYCLVLNLSLFVDQEKNTCDFQTEDFYRLLEYSGRFDAYEDNLYPSVSSTRVREALLYEVSFNEARDVMLLQQALGSGDMTFVGYPTADGSLGHLLEARGGSYSICTSSENKEGAWAFLETLLKDYKSEQKLTFDSTREIGFPADRETCELYFESEMADPYNTYINEQGEVVNSGRKCPATVDDGYGALNYYIPLPDEVDPIRELLGAARVDQNGNSLILSIIQEEAAHYFNGDKSTREVAEVIQARVSVYLGEKAK